MSTTCLILCDIHYYDPLNLKSVTSSGTSSGKPMKSTFSMATQSGVPKYMMALYV